MFFKKNRQIYFSEEEALDLYQNNLITWEVARRAMGLKASRRDSRYGKYHKENSLIFDSTTYSQSTKEEEENQHDGK